MSYVITAIISMIFGAGLALLVRNSGNISAEERAFKDGREFGYAEGYKAGDRDGFRAGIKRMIVMKRGRVDAAPGFDSVRTRTVINKPITGLRVTEITDDDIKKALVYMFGEETEARHD